MTQKENIAEQRRQLAGIIARDGEKERELLSQTSRLRREITELEGMDKGLSMAPDSTKAALVAAQKGRDARHAKISNLKADLLRLEAELAKVSPALLAAHQALGAIEQKINAERRVRVSAAIEAAIQQAPGRQAFHDARAKAGELRKRLADVETELHVLETSPPSNPANVEDRAAQLLATGTMPATGPVIDGSVRRNEIRGEIRTLTEAVRQQENHVSAAGRQFADELGAALRPTMGDIVQRIAAGAETARRATEEFGWLRVTVAVMTGGNGDLPACNFPGVPAPFPGSPDAFDFWLDRQRLAGFEV